MQDYTTPNEIIAKVGAYLRDELTIGTLVEQLTGLEKLRFELADKTTQWLQMLHEKENQMLYPKDKDKTELDRKIMLNASVAVIRKDYEMLLRLETLVAERIDFGKLLLTISEQTANIRP